jgi:hypothetical protein
MLNVLDHPASREDCVQGYKQGPFLFQSGMLRGCGAAEP